MKRNVLLLVLVSLTLGLTAQAGSISGKVSGVSGESVVYVDTIAGKTFPPPSDHPVMNQKGLLFQPHIMVVEAGTTVDFLNSDRVAHNLFWPSFVNGAKEIAGQEPGNMAAGREEIIQVRPVRCRAIALQCASGNGWLYCRCPDLLLRVDRCDWQLQNRWRSRRAIQSRGLARGRPSPD